MSFGRLSKADMKRMYYEICLTDYMEDKVSWDIKERKNEKGEMESRIPTVALIGRGEAAISVGTAFALLPQKDYIVFGHRSLGALTHFGLDPLNYFANHMCKADSPMHGRDGNIHFADFENHSLKFISHMIAGWPSGVGLAEGLKYLYLSLESEKYRNEPLPVVLCYCGDGASRQGLFHEAVNLAAVRNLPVGFIIDNNGIATDTPITDQMASQHISDMAHGYNIAGEYIANGNDVITVYNAASELIDHARKTARKTDLSRYDRRAPFILEGRTERMSEHNETRPAACVDLYDLAEWRSADPRELFRHRLLRLPNVEALQKIRDRNSRTLYQCSEMVFTAEELDEVEKNAHQRIDEAYEKAAAMPDPVPGPELLTIFPTDFIVPKERMVEPFPEDTKTKSSVMLGDALRIILLEEMRADKRIRMFGEDVGGKWLDGKRVGGGVYGITKNIIKDLGILLEQVFNTPLAENDILGLMIGLALAGQIPIGEIQYMPFLSVALSQAIDLLPTWFWSAGRPIHGILRLPCGAGTASGEFHSSMRLESILYHTPGLKMVYPSTPNDMYWLMKSAIHNDSPVFFFENRWGLSRIKGEITGTPIPIGPAALRATGSDMTIVAWGAKTWFDAILPAVQKMKAQGVSAELIDLRTLVPLDLDLIVNSVKKTHRLLIVHEDIKAGGVGQVLAGTLGEISEVFCNLLGKIMVVGSERCLVPQAPALEEWFLPSEEKVMNAMRQLMEWR